MKKAKFLVVPVLVLTVLAVALSGCTTALDKEGDFVLKARHVAFAAKSYVGWEPVEGAAGYKLYRNHGLDNFKKFGEDIENSVLVADNDQGSTDVEVEDDYADDGDVTGFEVDVEADTVTYPEFLYYKVFAYDTEGTIIAESNIATVFSHLVDLENITYETDVEYIKISWDQATSTDYDIMGYDIYLYDSSQDSYARNILLGSVDDSASPSFEVTPSVVEGLNSDLISTLERTEQYNYYLAPYDDIGTSYTTSGGRVFADLPGSRATQAAGSSVINVSWDAVTGANGTAATGYNVYLAYLRSGMSSNYLDYEGSDYNGDGDGDDLDPLNGSTPVTGTSFAFDYDGAGVEPYASMSGGDSYEYFFIVTPVSASGESGNYYKYFDSDDLPTGVEITK